MVNKLKIVWISGLKTIFHLKTMCKIVLKRRFENFYFFCTIKPKNYTLMPNSHTHLIYNLLQSLYNTYDCNIIVIINSFFFFQHYYNVAGLYKHLIGLWPREREMANRVSAQFSRLKTPVYVSCIMHNTFNQFYILHTHTHTHTHIYNEYGILCCILYDNIRF